MSSVRLYLDNLLNRDKYLRDINARIDHFKLIQSEPSQRVIDAVDTQSQCGTTVPEVEADALTIDVVKRAMRDSGCLIVRNYFNAREVKEMRAYVDHSFDINENRDKALQNYMAKQVSLNQVIDHTREDIERNIKLNSTYQDTRKLARNLTQALGKSAAHLTVKTPMIATKLLQLYDRKGLHELLCEYFEHEPCVSVYKWVLRRATAPREPIDFHQDGAFMGSHIDSLNLWVALTKCGAGCDAPGMDIVPTRLKGDFEKGSGVMDWTIGEGRVVEAFGEQGVVTPTFNPGDGLFFDHMLVHRTQHLPDNDNIRYAIETWFFDSANFPKNQIPMRW